MGFRTQTNDLLVKICYIINNWFVFLDVFDCKFLLGIFATSCCMKLIENICVGHHQPQRIILFTNFDLMSATPAAFQILWKLLVDNLNFTFSHQAIFIKCTVSVKLYFIVLSSLLRNSLKLQKRQVMKIYERSNSSCLHRGAHV